MNQFWIYSLSDLLMFSSATYYRLFELYNLAIWPAHLLAGAFGIALLACAARGGDVAGRVAAGVLAACWLWTGWAFHAGRYAQINLAANYFALGFGLEALLLFWLGTVRGRLTLAGTRKGVDRAALGLLLFALLGWPLLAPAHGRAWRQLELFGVAPDPTAAATLGLLLISGTIPSLLLPIPLLWCAISAATLWTMRAPDAWAMPLSALVALSLIAWRTAARRAVSASSGSTPARRE